MRWLARVVLLALVSLAASCADPGPVQPLAPPEAEPESLSQPALDQTEVLQELPDPQARQPVEDDEPVPQPETTNASQPAQPRDPHEEPELVMPDPSGPDAPAFDFDVALNYLTQLVEELGPRATGTDQERTAAAWIAEEFERLGYEVEIQEFRYRAMASFSRIDLPERDSIYGFRFPNSATDEATGDLVNVPDVGEEADFARVDVDGKVAIVDRGIIEFRVKAANAEAAGAVALIVVDITGDRGIGGTLGTYTSDIPVVLIRAEDGAHLRNRLGQSLTVPEAQPLTGASQNVVARKTVGQCRVVVGGHYDTVPAVDGANDNASGTALTLAFAALWAQHPSASEVCFVAFGAEEMGLHGSAAYVSELRANGTLSAVTAMQNLDAIGDGRAPYQIIASAELRSLTDRIARELQIDAAPGVLPTQIGSDHASFARDGVPVTFVFAPGAMLHVPADNLDNIDTGLYEDISRLNHAILSCLLLRAGSSITPSVPCREQTQSASRRATLGT